VRLHVVDGDKRFFPGEGEAFGGGNADEQAADEAGAVGHGDAREFLCGAGDAGSAEGFLDDQVE